MQNLRARLALKDKAIADLKHVLARVEHGRVVRNRWCGTIRSERQAVCTCGLDKSKK